MSVVVEQKAESLSVDVGQKAESLWVVFEQKAESLWVVVVQEVSFVVVFVVVKEVLLSAVRHLHRLSAPSVRVVEIETSWA